MGITPEDLDNAKLDQTNYAEAATSRAGGVAGGALIESSTNRFGETFDTQLGRLKKLGFLPPVGYASNIEFTANDYAKTVTYNGGRYAPIVAELPFTTTSWPTDSSKFYQVDKQGNPSFATLTGSSDQDLAGWGGWSAGSSYAVRGFSSEGKGSATWKCEQLNTTEPAGAVTFYTNGSVTVSYYEDKIYIPQGANYASFSLVDNQFYYQMFGAIADYNTTTRTGTDNQVILQAAEYFCEAAGKEIVIAGNFGIGSAIIHRNVARVGLLTPDSCGIFALNDRHRIFNWQSTNTSGQTSFKNFKVQGYAQDNTTQGGDQDVLIEVSPIDKVVFDGMEGAWGRQMGFKSRAAQSIANNCYLHHILRDGINFTDSEIRKVTDCNLKFIADDAIACHVAAGTTTGSTVKTKTTITGNTLFNCYGIKCLSSEYTVANNKGNMLFGYGVAAGVDAGFGEGLLDQTASNISDNTFTNIINLSKVGGGNTGAGLLFDSRYTPNANGFYVDEYDTTANVFVDPLANNAVFDATPSAGTFGVTITDNTFMQTWTGGANISDYGYGEAWTTSGFSDIALTGTLGKNNNQVFAYRFDDVASYIYCSPSVTYGTTQVYKFNNVRKMDNSVFRMGSATRIYDKAVDIVKSGGISFLDVVNSRIEGGTLNMDPLCEHPDRGTTGGEPDGTWTNTSSANCVAFSVLATRGVEITGISIANCQKIALVSGGGATTPLFTGLTYYRGYNSIANTGIGVSNFAPYQKQVMIDADPRNATYGDIVQGNMAPQSTLPTSGSYLTGQVIENNNYSATIGGNRFKQIVRLTTGSSNSSTLGVDWSLVALD